MNSSLELTKKKSLRKGSMKNLMNSGNSGLFVKKMSLFSVGGKEAAVKVKAAENSEAKHSTIESQRMSQVKFKSPHATMENYLRMNDKSASVSKLAEARAKRFASIDTKISAGGPHYDRKQSAMKNADFELGSAQFDVPLMNYNGSPRRSALNMANLNDNSPYPFTQKPSIEPPNRLHQAGPQDALQHGIRIDPANGNKNEGCFDERHFDSTGKEESASNVLRILTKYVTSKHKDEASIKDMLEHKKVKDRIFDNIFEQFARGAKLQKYDEYKLFEAYKKTLASELLTHAKEDHKKKSSKAIHDREI